jgi:hypothetical protein
MRPGLHGRPERDPSSAAAFSLLFVVPAVVSAGFWLVLRGLDSVVGLGELSLLPWLGLVLSPAILSATIAHWACRRVGTSASIAWGFSLGAALITPLFMLVAAAWLLNGGE